MMGGKNQIKDGASTRRENAQKSVEERERVQKEESLWKMLLRNNDGYQCKYGFYTCAFTSTPVCSDCDEGDNYELDYSIQEE